MPNGYHEDNLSVPVKDEHRAFVSLQEEVEAADWYNQRADAATDEELKKILIHNRNEEIEHASMLLEWLRRRQPVVDEQLRTYLFTALPITEVEDAAEAAEPESSGSAADGSLAIGAVKQNK
jgi:uncharacterized protein